MKRTRHKFAEVWQQGSMFVMKLRNGKYVEISDPNRGEFIQIGKEHDTAEQAMTAAVASHAKFVEDKVEFLK